MDWKKLQFWRKPPIAPNLDYEAIARYDAADSAEGDRAVIESLVTAGADLSLPREVLHYFYFPDENAAGKIVAELRHGGFEVEDPLQIGLIEETQLPWRVLATAETIVNLSTAQENTRWFRALATQSGGEYDGWEAAAKP